MLFSIIAIFIVFHLLSSTAENYLSPALAQLAKTIGCSETLAGITIVAFGNGAPDVLVAIAAGGGDDGDGINFVIGSIFGAGLFVTTITVALVIVSSKEPIKTNPNMFLRDAFFYFLATTLLILYGIIGYIKWWMAIIFVFLYVLFISVVLYMEF